MAKLFLVRHGQAAFGEDNYDQLSELGHQQARWLGEYFRERGVTFKRALAGGLMRQQDTAKSLLAATENPPPLDTHPGLDEYDGHALYTSHTGSADVAGHQKRDAVDYWRTFRGAYQGWVDGTLVGEHESWADFGGRIHQALSTVCTGLSREDNVLAVSSGGVIGTTIAGLLQTAPRSAIELNFQFRNSAFCEIIVGRSEWRLSTFNALPHLDRPDRRDAITFV